MEMVRFFLVSLAGVTIDLAVAYAVAIGLGAPLWLAAAIGFITAVGVNYLLHEVWTFQARRQRPSRKRALRYLGIALVTLMSRLAVVAWMGGWMGRDQALLILIAGAGVSFFVNYGLSKTFLFSKPDDKKGLT